VAAKKAINALSGMVTSRFNSIKIWRPAAFFCEHRRAARCILQVVARLCCAAILRACAAPHSRVEDEIIAISFALRWRCTSSSL